MESLMLDGHGVTLGDTVKGATFSPCKQYRYTLWRMWDASLPFAMFIGLNPSTADELHDDPTIRRCVRFSRDWDFGGYVMTNLFAFRSTNPHVMKKHSQPIGERINGHEVNDINLRQFADCAGIVIAAWGTHGAHQNRGAQVRTMLLSEKLHYLRLTRESFPAHPLYLPASLTPQPWSRTPELTRAGRHRVE